MKQAATRQYRSPTVALLVSLALFTIILLGWSIISIASLPFSGVVALATAVSVSAFIGRFQIRLPGSMRVLPVQILFACWGALWFGYSGGIVLGLLSTI